MKKRTKIGRDRRNVIMVRKPEKLMLFRMKRWCIQLSCSTLACKVIRYRLVQVRQNFESLPEDYVGNHVYLYF